jgi:hypothetical protein
MSVSPIVKESVMNIGYPSPPCSLATMTVSSNYGPSHRVCRVGLTGPEKTAAITKVRCLEHDLFDGDQLRRDISRRTAEAAIAELNQLRSALGWLEIDAEGHWCWPHEGH